MLPSWRAATCPELGTLQAYVAALGGHLRIVASEFGENTVELTA